MAHLLKHVPLIEPAVFLFLLLDVFPDHGLISANRRDEIPYGPEVLSREVAPASHKGSRDLNGAPALAEPTTCATEYLGGIETSNDRNSAGAGPRVKHFLRTVRHSRPSSETRWDRKALDNGRGRV